jgi:3-oxoacyl-[acyl-carrier-protein] synthase II
MCLALEDAGVSPEDVAHVNGHGTSTPLNDVAEARAVSAVFQSDLPPLTSIKGAIGHSIGAAGAVEAVASILSVNNRLVPPTANCRNVGSGIAADIVIGEPRRVLEGAGVSNSFAFGGHNATLVFMPFQET